MATPDRSSKRLSKRESWAFSFLDADPRRQILEFFKDGDERGPRGLLRSNMWQPTGNVQSTFFSVWRPTSLDAIRMMIEGKATGKGLNIKGKSAKKGRLSGFVPFLQISEEKHKSRVGTSPAKALIRIFFADEACRERARAALQPVLDEMVATAATAQKALDAEKASGVPLDDDVKEAHLLNLRFHTDMPRIISCDASGFGLEMPERLMWEAYVMRQDISHPPGWETGRPSEPDYMDMNFHSTRKFDPEQPKVVVYQHDDENPMNPRGLLVAYEETGSVLPVASDFDAFLFGSRGVEYPQIPHEQVQFLESLISHVENVLSKPDALTWTHRWLDVLKGQVKISKPAAPTKQLKLATEAKRRRSSISGSLGPSGKREDGRFGFGDDISRAMIEHACMRLNGAVRHAAECFNYYWPQELDEEFLVVWEGYTSTKWRYLNAAELRAFLIERVGDGFVFPLNPTWILRDEGWHEVFDALEREPRAQQALDAWFPPNSGLREQIRAIHERFPEGFVRTRTSMATDDDSPSHDYELAQLALKRYKALRRAKIKIKVVLKFAQIAREAAAKRRAAESTVSCADDDDEVSFEFDGGEVVALKGDGAAKQSPAAADSGKHAPSWCLSA